MFAIETGINGDQPGEAAKHQTRADREQKREGDFGDDKKPAQTLMAANAPAESALFERVLEVDARETQCRN